ncbi:MAG TPA: CDF family Co(II)/Ni(II) efflux transporter DmeF [Allosphingosinicella sp.]|nr:CDF family Co(II)/Ni(II) efflux transporter DmeF [Allosphingosinicella sp.]
MHSHSDERWQHDHAFLGEHHARNELRMRLVIALTLAMMAGEVTAGILFGSMALLADGLHMATHAGALALAAAAYAYARRHLHNPRFAFGTGKVGDLAAFTSAVTLAIVALLIAWESVERLAEPVAIDFAEAIAVACLGLAVNLASAWLLRGRGHGAGDHTHHHHDHNLRAAYLHLLADALTSILAIGGLAAGSLLGWVWMDPAIGLIGAAVIARWSWGLMRDSGAVLLDAAGDPALSKAIRSALETGGDLVPDLHVWRVGPGHMAAVLTVVSHDPESPAAYKARLGHLRSLCHITVEVHRCE